VICTSGPRGAPGFGASSNLGEKSGKGGGPSPRAPPPGASAAQKHKTLNIPLIGTALPRIVSLHHVNNPPSWPESLRETRIVLRDFRQILHAKAVYREIFSVYIIYFQRPTNFLGKIHQNTEIAALPPKSRPDWATI
jgi:hypothetical protein